MKQISFLVLCFLVNIGIAGAQSVIFTGTIKDAGTGSLLKGVNVSAFNVETSTDDNGFFSLQIPTRRTHVTLNFYKDAYAFYSQVVETKGRPQVDLGIIQLAPATNIKDLITNEDRIPIITLSEGEEESELGPQNISGILSASRDPFIAAAAFNLSTGGFNPRGYRAETTVLFNGMPFNNLENNSVFWSVWSGLNDVTRRSESAIDLSANSWSFGGIGGYTTIDTRASKQQKQRRVSYMFSNRTYTNRLMATWNTGMLKSGWAFSLSGSRRWAQEGYVPGTFYNAWSYFASVDRKLGKNHLLNLTALAAPVRRGSQGASVQEMNDLAGTNFYNPNWGWQAGKKRNARVVDAHQPLAILRHDWKINKNSTLVSAVGFQTGRYGRSTLDWFKAPDPRADYYRKLPLYTQLTNPDFAAEIREKYQNNPDLMQIQWDDFYQGNTENGKSWNGTPGNWSQVILSEERSDATKLNASSTYESVVSDHFTFNLGVFYQQEKTHYFKKVKDLLGGDYYVNIDRFALSDNLPQEATRYNLEDDNVILHQGDTHGWDYDITGRRLGTWMQGQFTFRKVDFFVAGNLTTTEFWRTGYFRNGRFPNSSFGKSDVTDFSNYGAKAGLTFKMNGRNYLYANGTLLNRAPDPRIAYASSRNRDQLVPGLTDEKVAAWEAGYKHHSPGLNARATFFYSRINDGLKLNRFFLPGDISNFGSYILTNLDERHAGIELAAQVKITPTFSFTGAACISENIYTDRPNGIFIQDDDGKIRERGIIYIKNFYVPNTPQTALSGGLEYRSPRFWSASLTVNYFDRNYLDFSPERRTEEQVFGLDPSSDSYRKTIEQINVYDKSDIGFELDHFTVDLFANKSFKINRNTFFNLTAGVTNLLNATIIQGGYEQLRYERADVEQTGINVFPPRYFYAYGTNFFLLGALKF